MTDSSGNQSINQSINPEVTLQSPESSSHSYTVIRVVVSYISSHSCPGADWQKRGCQSAPTAPLTTTNIHSYSQNGGMQERSHEIYGFKLLHHNVINPCNTAWLTDKPGMPWMTIADSTNCYSGRQSFHSYVKPKVGSSTFYYPIYCLRFAYFQQIWLLKNLSQPYNVV